MDAKAAKHRINNLHQLHLIQERVGAHDVTIELPELTVTAFLWTVCTPYRLHLVTFERQLEFFAVHHHITGKGHSEVVTQTFLTHLCSQMEGITLFQFLVCHLSQTVTGVQHFEEQLVALFAVLTHQRAESFHRRRLYLLETIELIHLFDGIEDIVALGHLHRGEITRALRNTWFCHISFNLARITRLL